MADFTHLGVIGTPPLILVATNAFAADTSAAKVAKPRDAPPGGIAYATSDVGGILHLSTEMLDQHFATRFDRVPYGSSAQTLQAIHIGEVRSGIAALASANAMVRAGSARAVAVLGHERFPTCPYVPALAEAGIPGFRVPGFLHPGRTARHARFGGDGTQQVDGRAIGRIVAKRSPARHRPQCVAQAKWAFQCPGIHLGLVSGVW